MTWQALPRGNLQRTLHNIIARLQQPARSQLRISLDEQPPSYSSPLLLPREGFALLILFFCYRRALKKTSCRVSQTSQLPVPYLPQKSGISRYIVRLLQHPFARRAIWGRSRNHPTQMLLSKYLVLSSKSFNWVQRPLGDYPRLC